MNTEEIRRKFRPGTVVRIIKMIDSLPDAYHVPSGTEGIVTGVDDSGTVLMSWENGSSLGLMVNDDEYEILQEAEQC